MRRNILVVGATGKQGSAVIKSLLLSDPQKSSHSGHEYHIYALTRSSVRLRPPEPGVTMMVGNLDNPTSIIQVFDDVKAQSGGIWGVVAILMYPGLGANADGEEKQGKMLADLALEHGVQSFIYSSGNRAGPKYENLLTLSGKAKSAIENYCKDLGKKGLPWTIIRPGFFMENFNDFVGSITASVLKVGLAPNTSFGLVASEDVGNAVAGIFKNHEKYIHCELAIVGQVSTIAEINADHQAATGRPLPAVPELLGSFLLSCNKGLQDLITTMDRSHYARSCGEYPLWEVEFNSGSSTCETLTYYQWLKKENREEDENKWGWNQISLAKLFMGRS